MTNSGITIERVGECSNCGRDTFSVANHIVCGASAAFHVAHAVETEMRIEPNEEDARIAYEILVQHVPEVMRREFPVLMRGNVTVRLYSDIHSRALHFGYPDDVLRKEELCLNSRNHVRLTRRSAFRSGRRE